MKTSLLSVTLALLTLFPSLASAELNEEASRLEAAVIVPTKAERDATVKKNKELAEWNAEHEETLSKLNAVAEVLNCKWDEQDGAKNQQCEIDIRESLTTLWNLEKDEAIESLTALRDLVMEIRDRKLPDTETFQFSSRTRLTYFDGLLKQIEAIETMAEDNAEAVPFRAGPHGMDFPTLSRDANGGIAATSAKALDTAKVDSLNAFLAKAEKLKGAVLSCPSRETVSANLAQLQALVTANEKETTRLLDAKTAAQADETDRVSKSKELQAEATRRAEAQRAENVRNAARTLVADALTISVVATAADGKITLDGKPTASVDAEKTIVESLTTDVLSDKFVAGHEKLVKALKRKNRAQVSAQNPAPIAKIDGLETADQFGAKVTADGQAQLFLTKLDIKKVEAIPASFATALTAIDEAHGKTLAKLEQDHAQREKMIRAAIAQQISALDQQREAKRVEHVQLTKERTSLTHCHANLPIVAGKVKAMKAGVEGRVLDETTQELELLKQEADVPSLRKK